MVVLRLVKQIWIMALSAPRANEMIHSAVSAWIDMVGMPRSYHRFMVNAKAILQFDAYEALDKFACPTYIIGGDEDHTVGIEASYELQKRIKHSELYVYKGLGHAAYEEAGDFYNKVYEFLVKELDKKEY